jgi:hypothetical protein
MRYYLGSSMMIYIPIFLCLAVCHATYVLYLEYMNPSNMRTHELSRASVEICKQSTLLQLDHLCDQRMQWAHSSYCMNIIRVTVDEHIEHLHSWLYKISQFFTYASGLTLWCNHGSICRYNVTRICDSITGITYMAIPLVVIAVTLFSGCAVYQRIVTPRNWYKGNIAYENGEGGIYARDGTILNSVQMSSRCKTLTCELP